VLDTISDLVGKVEKKGRYDLMYMKAKELGWKGEPRDSKYWHRRLSGE